ncbi:MAG: TIGR02444 family protein [Rhodospirillales bacterium]|nr:TIGR02444 family protein [Rhodospirillales bacterium]
MECNSVTSAWRFAVDIYGRPGVREACLALQDRRGADVVAMLVLLHGAARGHPAPSQEVLAAALAAVAPWRRSAVLALRAIRRDLKQWSFPEDIAPDCGAERARQAVAAAELAAERVELDYLARRLGTDSPGAGSGAPPTLAAATAVLALYGRAAALAFDAADLKDLAILAAAALPDSPAGTAAPAGHGS